MDCIKYNGWRAMAFMRRGASAFRLTSLAAFGFVCALGIATVEGADEMRRQGPDRLSGSDAVGSRIIFSSTTTSLSRDGIYTINSDGTDVREVIRDGREPRWAKDCTKILFYQPGKGISIADSDGQNIRIVTDGWGFHDGDLSPNGDRIVFVDKAGSGGHLVVMNVDGSDQHHIGVGEDFDYHPKWFPDGKRIVFVANDAPGHSADYIFSVNHDGTGLRPLIRGSYPEVSPDGQRIVFTDHGGYGDGGVYTVNVDGSGLRTVVERSGPWPYGWESSPSWSQDGSRIVFVRARPRPLSSASRILVVVNSDGGGYSELAPRDDSNDDDPDWSCGPVIPTPTATATVSRTPTSSPTLTPTPSPTRAPLPTIGRVWTADPGGIPVSVFKTGTELQFRIEIVNTTGTVRLFDATAAAGGPVPSGGSQPYRAVLGEWSGRADTGTTTHSGKWTIPWDAPTGAYTFQVNVRFTGGGLLTGTAGFMVTPGIAPCPPGAAPGNVPIPQKPHSAVGGRVTDRVSGQPIKGASVLIGDRAGQTDDAGVFSVYDVATGIQPLLVARVGQADYAATIVVMSDACVTADIEMSTTFMLQWPVENGRGRISSYFDHELPDYRKDGTILTYDARRYKSGTVWYPGHNGLDIGKESWQTPLRGVGVLAAAAGTASTVVLCPDPCAKTGYGRHVVVDHGNGFSTLYGHLGSIDVAQGDAIAAGQRLGAVGSTGNSTGPHLHFTPKRDGKAMDPLGWYPNEAIPTDPWATKGGPESYAMFSNGPMAAVQSFASAGQAMALQSADRRVNVAYTPGSGESAAVISLQSFGDATSDPQADRDGEFDESEAAGVAPFGPQGVASTATLDDTVVMEGMYSFVIAARDASGRPKAAFTPPANVVIRYADLLDDMDESRLTLYFWNDAHSAWEQVPATVSARERTLTATVQRTGRYRVTSGAPAPDVKWVPGGESELANLSTRAASLTGDNVIIGGFIVEGGPLRVVVRAIGPDLGNRGVPGALQDPVLTLYRGQSVVAQNDDWESAEGADEARARRMAPPHARESVIITTLEPGGYTAIIQGKDGATGIALVEVFRVSGSGSLVNLSTRAPTLTGDQVLIGGFIVQNKPTRVVVRVLGPDLLGFGVPNALLDPTLEIYSGATKIAENDDWVKSGQVEAIRWAELDPGSDKDPAILLTLPPGAYTAIVRGAGGATGIALVEVFRVGEKGEAYPGPGE